MSFEGNGGARLGVNASTTARILDMVGLGGRKSFRGEALAQASVAADALAAQHRRMMEKVMHGQANASEMAAFSQRWKLERQLVAFRDFCAEVEALQGTVFVR